jgi:hypothetical protein
MAVIFLKAFGTERELSSFESARIEIAGLDRNFENQSFRASGLSLITAAIVHWNTVYLDRAVQQLRARGATVPDDLLAHVAPLGWEHIGLTGDYLRAEVTSAARFRPLRDVRATFPARAA